VLARGYEKKFAVSNQIEDHELDYLKAQGLHIHVMKDITAIGNLLCLQANGGIVSPSVLEMEQKALHQFFDIPLHMMSIARSELAGSSIVATEKGFLASARAVPEEMQRLEEIFRVPGMTTTANYGDAFIGNSVIANNHGIIVGERTSGPELARIDEGLHPGLQ
jgi:translation initiation factor 6